MAEDAAAENVDGKHRRRPEDEGGEKEAGMAEEGVDGHGHQGSIQ